MSTTVRIHRQGDDKPTVQLELIGDDELAGGNANWSTIDRYARTPMTKWEGTTATTWTLPLSFDGFEEGRSVERAIAVLDGWQQPDDTDDEPAVLRVDAPLGRARATAKWVITNIEWGEQIRNSAGQRVRQDIRLTLLEHEPGQIKKGPAAKSRDKAKKHKWVAISAKDRRCKVCKKPRDDKRHNNR